VASSGAAQTSGFIATESAGLRPAAAAPARIAGSITSRM